MLDPPRRRRAGSVCAQMLHGPGRRQSQRRICTHRRCSRSSIPRWNASKRISLVDDFELRPSASPVRTGGTPTGAGQEDEYEHWFNRDGGWSEEPGFDQSWRFSTPSEGLDTVCDLMTPTRVDDVDAADDATLRNQATQWRSEIDSLRGSYDTDHATEHLAQAAQDEETIRRVWLSYTGRERESRNRLDRAATSAAMLMRDTEQSKLLSDKDRRNLNDLIGRARMILHTYANPLGRELQAVQHRSAGRSDRTPGTHRARRSRRSVRPLRTHDRPDGRYVRTRKGANR